ncbi:MAG: hypothetical protein Q7J82_01650 [Coriobacteriia bacterium]|nr:hypothetical protein [Coriobacteriia bacterium]
MFLLWRHLFGTWLYRPFPLMIIVAVVYHGLNELLLLIPGADMGNMYRAGLDLSDVYLGAFVVSGGILIASLAYLVALGHDGRRAHPDISGLQAAMRPLDWRLLLAVTIPLAVVTFSGRGYGGGVILDSRNMSFLEIIASALFLVLVILTTFAFVMKHGRRSFIPAVAVQSVIVAACGQRLEVLLATVVICMMVTAFTVAPTKRQLITVFLISSLLVVSITSVRAESDRVLFNSDTGLFQRVAGMGTALFDVTTVEGRAERGMLAQVTERFDANEWAGAVMHGLDTQEPMGGLGGVFTSLGLAVPTIINHSKLESGLSVLNNKWAQVYYFHLVPVDHLPGHFGLWLGLVGPWIYLPLMGVFGFAFAKLEKWTLRKASAARIILFVLLAVGALFYERGIPSMFVVLRYGIVLCPLAFWAQRVLQKLSAATMPIEPPSKCSK